jgi:hypothetical protein
LKTINSASSTLKIEITQGAVQNPLEIEATIAAFGREPSGAVLLLPDPLVQSHQRKITELAASFHLATLGEERTWREQAKIDAIDPSAT